MSDMNQVMKTIAASATHAVMPASLLRKSIVYSPKTSVLDVKGKEFPLQRNVVLVGFGKAVLGMANELYKLIGDHIIKGVLSVPVGATQQLQDIIGIPSGVLADNKIKIYECAQNNLPDVASLNAAKEILHLCSQCDANDLVIALVSGGGSALLSLPVDGISIQDKREAISRMSKAGATIQELNVIRQMISKVKGGRLAQQTLPAKLLSLIISDIIDDPIELIAAGPTVPPMKDNQVFVQTVLSKHQRIFKDSSFPDSVRSYISSMPIQNQLPTHVDEQISNFIIGNNSIALEAAAETAKKCGYDPIILSSSVEGNVIDVGRCYVDIATWTFQMFNNKKPQNLEIPFLSSIDSLFSQIHKKAANGQRKICLISGGETTVIVQGDGVGGRNQELCLHFAKLCSTEPLLNNSRVMFMSFGTDGQDGPTDAAGAIVYGNSWQDMINSGLDPNEYIRRNDSNTLLKYFSGGDYLITTGLTGTNVMDIQVLLFDF